MPAAGAPCLCRSGGGLCFLNNSAIDAEDLRRRGLRPAILDVDVHHGNGAQGIFYARKDVLTVSVHPDPARFYPFYWGHAHERGVGEGNNFKLNNLADYEILPDGLWSKKDTLTFYSGNQLASSVYHNTDIENSIQIEVDSLNNLLNGISGKRIFIKMNIEGAELEALSACTEVIENNKVHLAIAADHTVSGQLTCERVQELCRGMNLSVTTLTRDKIITVYASNEYEYSSEATL